MSSEFNADVIIRQITEVKEVPLNPAQKEKDIHKIFLENGFTKENLELINFYIDKTFITPTHIFKETNITIFTTNNEMKEKLFYFFSKN
jgi:hypothetical protein